MALKARFFVTSNNDGSFVIRSLATVGDVDTVRNVEFLRFTDGDVRPEELTNRAPVANNITVMASERYEFNESIKCNGS